MRDLRLALSLAATASALVSVPASGCSVVAGYRAPTNLELAAQADAIVLAQVVDGAEAAGPDSLLTVRPLAAIKGLLPGQEFPLRGMALGAVAPTDPLELAEPHPEALAGACIRRTFPRGATVLLFLDRADGEWVPAGGPFSRWAEDVSGEDAPWVQLARFYARIAPLSTDQRTALLEAERDALSARADDPAAQAMAADLARTIAEPDPALAQAPPPDDGFRGADEPTSVERMLDAMRADR